VGQCPESFSESVTLFAASVATGCTDNSPGRTFTGKNRAPFHGAPQKWTFARKRPGHPGIMKEVSSLILRRATDNPAWGHDRIQGALKNLDPRVARSTVAKGAERQRDPARAGAAVVLAYPSAGPLGRVAGADFVTTQAGRLVVGW
jgi:hypothetical protein